MADSGIFHTSLLCLHSVKHLYGGLLAVCFLFVLGMTQSPFLTLMARSLYYYRLSHSVYFIFPNPNHFPLCFSWADQGLCQYPRLPSPSKGASPRPCTPCWEPHSDQMWPLPSLPPPSPPELPRAAGGEEEERPSIHILFFTSASLTNPATSPRSEGQSIYLVPAVGCRWMENKPPKAGGWWWWQGCCPCSAAAAALEGLDVVRV